MQNLVVEGDRVDDVRKCAERVPVPADQDRPMGQSLPNKLLDRCDSALGRRRRRVVVSHAAVLFLLVANRAWGTCAVDEGGLSLRPVFYILEAQPNRAR